MEISSDFFAAMEGDINDQKEGKERVALSIEHRSSLVSLFIEMDLKKDSPRGKISKKIGRETLKEREKKREEEV